MTSLQGKRTGVAVAEKGTIPVNENGMEDVNEFWDAAKTPKETANNGKKPLKPKNQDKKGAAAKPRFSLPGVSNETPDGTDVTVNKYLDKVIHHEKDATWSPGDMSRVSTLPPSPNTAARLAREQELSPTEAVRASPEEEEEEVAEIPHASDHVPSPTVDMPADDFPMDDGDDDDDDMVPPPPPEEEEETHNMESTIDETAATTPDAVDFPRDDDDDDDDDKEGPGFDMAEDPDTPEETKPKKAVAKKQKKKPGRKKKDASSVVSGDTSALPKKRKNKKKTKRVAFSPQGYQSGPREFKAVPISDLKESPEDKNVRRSRRARVTPLEFWKNEQYQYGDHGEDGTLGEAMGGMSVPTGVLQALPTPYKKREMPANHGAHLKKKNNKRSSMQMEDTPFDSKKLRKKYKIIDGEKASIWEEGLEDVRDSKVVSYVDKMKSSELPLPRARKKAEGKVVGLAAQSFNIPSDESDQYVGYIMGNLSLPPNGIKDPESTGSCSQVFTVCSGQPKAIEIAYSDPSEEEGSFDASTAQRFLLSAGDQFRIPPGNCYRLHNHSKSTDGLLAWTIIRPRRAPVSP